MPWRRVNFPVHSVNPAIPPRLIDNQWIYCIFPHCPVFRCVMEPHNRSLWSGLQYVSCCSSELLTSSVSLNHSAHSASQSGLRHTSALTCLIQASASSCSSWASPFHLLINRPGIFPSHLIGFGLNLAVHLFFTHCWIKVSLHLPPPACSMTFSHSFLRIKTLQVNRGSASSSSSHESLPQNHHLKSSCAIPAACILTIMPH